MTTEQLNEAKSILARVDMGRLDAERDARLLDYFLDTGAVDAVRAGKFLVTGRKGSGKTSIFLHLADVLHGRIVEMDLDKYVFESHRRLIEAGVPAAFAYTESWRIAYSVAMFAAVAQDLAWLQRFKGKRLIRKLGAGPNGGPIAAILDWFARVRNIRLPSVAGAFDLGELELESPRTSVDPTTSKQIDALNAVMASAIREDGVTVLLDRLDDAWDGESESLRVIAGAVRAARDFAIAYASTSRTVPPVVVFLRSDLWEKCNFNDKNKIAGDTVELDWNDDSLGRVIELRVSKSADVTEKEAWETLFTTERMRQSVTAKSYVLKRALGRPRDVVAYVSAAIEAARAAGHRVIEKSDVYDAESTYSKHILNELEDELAAHVLSFAAVVDCLRALKLRTFGVEKWVSVCADYGMDEVNAKVVLQLLFESGAVGVLQSGGAGGGRGTVFHYERRLLQVTAPRTQLQVHPALTKELQLTEKYSPRSGEPDS